MRVEYLRWWHGSKRPNFPSTEPKAERLESHVECTATPYPHLFINGEIAEIG